MRRVAPADAPADDVDDEFDFDKLDEMIDANIASALAFDIDDRGNVVERGGPEGEGDAGRASQEKPGKVLSEEMEGQVRRLVVRLAETRSRVDGLEAASRRAEAKVARLVQQNRDLQVQLTETEDERDAALASAGGGGLLADLKAVGGGAAVRLAAVGDDTARRRREEARRQMLTGVELIEEEYEVVGSEARKWWSTCARRVHAVVLSRVPFQSQIRFVDARFGSSVASFFLFYRWVFLNIVLSAVIAAFFLIKHLVRGSFGWGELVGSFVPRFMLLSSYTIVEALDFAGILVSVMFVLVVFAIRKYVQEDLVSKSRDALTQDKSFKYSAVTLCCWDHSLLGANEIADLKYANGEAIALCLHESRLSQITASRTRREKAVLFLRRAAGVLLAVIQQGIAGFVILQLTVTSSSLEATVRKDPTWSVLAPFASSIVPAAVSALNLAQPAIIGQIAKLERWDSAGTELKWTVWRLFVAKLVNVVLLVMSWAELADPYLFRSSTLSLGASSDFLYTMRTSTERGFQESSYRCRADQVGAGLFQLALTEFVTSKLFFVLLLYGSMGYSASRSQEYKKGPYDVATAIVDLMYFVQLMFMAFAFTPLSLLIIAPLLAVNFRWEVFALRKWYAKPSRPWAAKDAGRFFGLFYVITLAFCVLGVGVVLTNSTFPKDCSVQDAVNADIYGGAEPWCAGLAKAQSLYEVSTGTAAERLAVLGRAGGEVQHWLRVDCPTQCSALSAGPGESECRSQCSNGTNLVLSCFRTTAAYTNGTLVGSNVTRPCDLACGPFVSLPKPFSAVSSFFIDSDASVLRSLYLVLVDPAFIWTVVIAATVVACMKWNSLSVAKELHEEHDAALKALIDGLERKVRSLTRRLGVLTTHIETGPAGGGAMGDSTKRHKL